MGRLNSNPEFSKMQSSGRSGCSIRSQRSADGVSVTTSSAYSGRALSIMMRRPSSSTSQSATASASVTHLNEVSKSASDESAKLWPIDSQHAKNLSETAKLPLSMPSQSDPFGVNHEEVDLHSTSIDSIGMSSLDDEADSYNSVSDESVAYDIDIGEGLHNDEILDKAIRRRSRKKRQQQKEIVSNENESENPEFVPVEVVVLSHASSERDDVEEEKKSVTAQNRLGTLDCLDSTRRGDAIYVEMSSSGQAMSDISSLGQSQKRLARKSYYVRDQRKRAENRASQALKFLQNISDEESFIQEGECKTMIDDPQVIETTQPAIKEQTMPKRRISKTVKPIQNRETKIKFGNIIVRTYERILGDNPCSTGPPLSIGWRYNHKRAISIDDFERVRLTTRRESHDLVLSRERRERILMTIGYSRAELAVSVRQNIKIKNQRRQTVHNLNVSKIEEAFEKVRRKVKHIFAPNWKHQEK